MNTVLVNRKLSPFLLGLVGDLSIYGYSLSNIYPTSTHPGDITFSEVSLVFFVGLASSIDTIMTEKHRHQMALEQYLHVHLIIIQRYPVCINDFSKFQLWLLMEASDLQLHIIHDTEQVTALIIELVNCTRSQLDCEDQIQLASYEVGQAVHAVMAVANSDIVMNAGQVMADSATSLGHAVDIAKKHIEGVKIRPAIRVLEQFIANERVI